MRCSGRLAEARAIGMQPNDPNGNATTASDSAMNARVLAALREARTRIEALERQRSEPIAVVSMACRLPGGANSPEAFWQLLREGRDAIGPIPPDRWRVEDYFSADPEAPGKINVSGGGFIELPKAFDAEFFGIAPREAVSLDPQQRLMLEVSWEALESAGLAGEGLNGQQIGVFAAICWNDYGQRLLGRQADQIDAYMASGIANSMAAGRLSHILGLQGPSLTVDTACSSSLVAVHLACQSLRNGECTAAIAGAASLLLHPSLYVNFTKARMLSPDNRCKTFSAAANGFVRSEGCAVIVLKRLSDARAAGDDILGVIRGSAINHDGHTSGLTVPNGPAQQDVIRRALRDAGLTPADVGFIEAHGTGTSLGDPIEVGALAAVFGSTHSSVSPLVLGAVKSNIGHLEAAAGLAGLIKVVLALRHGEIPPNLHFDEPNPHIPWMDLPFVVPRQPHAWAPGPRGRIAGLSSFGFSGTNGHIVLGEAPVEAARATQYERPQHVIALSARSPGALAKLAEACAERIDRRPQDLADVCYSSNTARPQFQHRVAIAVDSASGAAEALRRAARGESDARIACGRAERGRPPRAAFLFTGQGSQYAGMGRELYDTQPVFRTALDRCATLLEGTLDTPLLELLYDSSIEATRIDATGYTQPALFSFEYALAELWMSWGVRPSVVLGHSVGEYVAACIAGVFSLEDALRLIAARGRLMQALPSGGAMLAVLADEPTVAPLVDARRNEVAIAAFNGPSSIVLSGSGSALNAIATQLTRQGVRATPLTVSHAFHSPLMAPMLEAFAEVARSVRYSPPRIDLISNVTGELATKQVATPEYWIRHISEPVRFAAGMRATVQRSCTAYIEIGPRPVLIGMGRQCLPDVQTVWLASVRPDLGEWTTLLGSLCVLHAQGFAVDWRGFDRPYPRRRVSVPTYPFERRPYWIEEQPVLPRSATQTVLRDSHELLGARVPLALSETVYATTLRAGEPQYLADHVVAGRVLMPATGFIEMFLAASRNTQDSASATLEDVLFSAPLPLDDTPRSVQVVLDKREHDGCTIRALSQGSADEEWSLHATTRIVQGPRPKKAPQIDLQAFMGAAEEIVEAARHYERSGARGISFGTSFRGVERIWRRGTEALARIEVPPSRVTLDRYVFHPAVLDACLQTASALVTQETSEAFIPMSIARLTVHARPAAKLYSYARLSSEPTADGITADLFVYDEQGELIASVEAFACRRLAASHRARDGLDSAFHEVVWRSSQRGAPSVTRGHWLIVSETLADGESIARELTAKGHRTTIAVHHSNVANDASTAALNLHDRDQLTQWISQAASTEAITGLLYCGSLQDSRFDSSEAGARFGQEHAGFVLALAQARAQCAQDAPLYVITRGLHSVRGERTAAHALEDAATWGLARVVAREYPRARCVRIDLDPDIALTANVEALIAEITSSDFEDEIALRDGVRHVARLRRAESTRASNGTVAPIELTIPNPGVLQNLRLQPSARRSPLEGEVEIEVRATGVGFRDVLNALGMYPGGPVPLGCECAGIVASVGRGVTGLRVGDEVLAVAYGSFASFVTVPAQWVAKKPAKLSFEQAAGIPSSFLTAHYTLNVLAGVQRGQRVLIHAGAGGVGQAAIQVALRAGAEVFATAGSAAKRALLTSLGVHHVLDSRSLDFVADIARVTNGRGVDVVLNSLAGEFLTGSFTALAEDGCFLEIGKRDILSDEEAARLKPRARYHVVDLGALSPSDPGKVEMMLGEILAAFEAGEYRALPIEAFPLERAADAFRYMAQARHAGKIVLNATQPRPDHGAVRGDATYLITGGLGALGIHVAESLVERGAKCVVLVGRNAPGMRARESIARMEKAGVRVIVAHADVADTVSLAHVLQSIRSSLPPLRGVFHAAGVLDDGALDRYEWDRFQRVLGPKARGAWNLHALTQQDDLDHFVLFAAAAGLLGLPGQGGYAAANTYLDALAHYRRSRGQRALSIDWGAWSGAGMANNENAVRALGARGLEFMSPEDGVAALWRALQGNACQLAILRVDWAKFRERDGVRPEGSLLAEFTSTKSAVTTSDREEHPAEFLTKFTATSPNRRHRVLLDFVIAEIRKAVGLPENYPVDERQPLQELGLDSLMAVELRNALSAGVKLTLPATFAFDYTTAEAISRYLLPKLSPDASSSEAVPTRHASHAVAHGSTDEDQAIENMSDEEAARLLFQELAEIKNDVES